VDCPYCHGGGPQENDINPRKDLARKMILLVRQINANFPGTGVFPVGPQVVTCYTVHRGDPPPHELVQQTVRADGGQAPDRARSKIPIDDRWAIEHVMEERTWRKKRTDAGL
jgi:hypothetical protein